MAGSDLKWPAARVHETFYVFHYQTLVQRRSPMSTPRTVVFLSLMDCGKPKRIKETGKILTTLESLKTTSAFIMQSRETRMI